MNKRGFSLIEALVAILIMTGGLIGVYSAVQNISSLAKDSNTRLQASFLALEGTEVIRSIRDNNYKIRDQGGDREWDNIIRYSPGEFNLYQVDYMSSANGTDSLMPLEFSNSACGNSAAGLKNIISGNNMQEKKRCFGYIYDDDILFSFLNLIDNKYSHGNNGTTTAFKRIVLVSPSNTPVYSGHATPEERMEINSVVIWQYRNNIRWVIVTANLFDWQDKW